MGILDGLQVVVLPHRIILIVHLHLDLVEVVEGITLLLGEKIDMQLMVLEVEVDHLVMVVMELLYLDIQQVE